MTAVGAFVGLSFQPLVQALGPHDVATRSDLEGRAVVDGEGLAADVAYIVFFNGSYFVFVIGNQWDGHEWPKEVRHC